jgi:hypothetical protein
VKESADHILHLADSVLRIEESNQGPRPIGDWRSMSTETIEGLLKHPRTSPHQKLSDEKFPILAILLKRLVLKFYGPLEESNGKQLPKFGGLPKELRDIILTHALPDNRIIEISLTWDWIHPRDYEWEWLPGNPNACRIPISTSCISIPRLKPIYHGKLYTSGNQVP